MSEKEKKVNLFDMSDDDSTMSFLDEKKRNADGIYRPSIEDAVDKKEGYKATIRFLPNFKKDGTVGASAIEKHLHYAKLLNNPDLKGYYECKKNLGDNTCPLCTTYWELYNSKNAADKEKAELIKRNTKYYSYILVIEDENNKELEGKILIYPFGFKIKEKINAQKKGELDGIKSNIFDLANGKDFRLIIKENKTPQGVYPNYDASSFLEASPIKINGKKVPVEKNEAGKIVITNEKIQKGLQDFLLKRDVDLDEYEAKPWTDEETNKVEKIIALVNGSGIAGAKSSIGKASKETFASTQEDSPNDTFSFEKVEDDNDVDDFFNVEGK
jgi:hypothetical protein